MKAKLATGRTAHNKHVILPGDVFHCLTVVEELSPYTSKSGIKTRLFRFSCQCGKIVDKKISDVRGRTKSCGCYNASIKTTHGGSSSRLYTTWQSIKQRCSNKSNKKYAIYGGKGIKVCSEWQTFECFSGWALSNGYRDDLTIDRINSDHDYSPENCRWADYKTQNNNTNRNHILLIYGEKKTVAQWATDDRCKVGYETFAARIKRGWDEEKALTEPAQRRNK